ncbi:MAG: alanine racemase [Coriobacteriales bacterium]|nr:alanine racemase [Coriobacteriales bacterium]
MTIDNTNYFGSNVNIPDDFGKKKDNLGQPLSSPKLSLENIKLPSSYSVDTLTRDAWIEIDLNAVYNNIKRAQAQLPYGCEIMAVVKADGYGHGAIECSKVALQAGCTRLAVSNIEEAVELRDAGINAPIVLLSQPPVETVEYLLAYDITPSYFTAQIALQAADIADKYGKVLKYHLIVDTGMNRIGLQPNEACDFLQNLSFHRALELEGIFTHFATADCESDWEFNTQLRKFNNCLDEIKQMGINPGIVHASNSAAIYRYPQAHFDMVRMGVTMYGLYPSEVFEDKIDLEPAMSIKAKISHIKEPNVGEGVSYGLEYRIGKHVQIATLPLGYADGLPFKLSDKMLVACNGNLYKQVGRICMDQCMFEVSLEHSLTTRPAPLRVGDEVVIIGKSGDKTLTLETMAQSCGTINYELACNFGLRLPKVFV